MTSLAQTPEAHSAEEYDVLFTFSDRAIGTFRELDLKNHKTSKFLEIKKTLQNSKCMTSFQGVLINCLINYLISLHLINKLPSIVHIRIYHRVLQYDLP